MSSCRVVLLALMLAGTLVLPAIAQDAREEAFRKAEEMLRASSSEEGIAILDSLFAIEPADYRVYIRLKEAYTDRGEYEKAIEVAALHLESGEPTPAGYADMASLHHDAGNLDRAKELWDRAIEIAPDELSTYQSVYRSLTEAQRFNRAVEVIYQAREQLGVSDAFAHELPYLLAAARRYEEAGREYALAVRTAPDRLRFVQNRISPFLDVDDARQPLIAGVSQVVRGHDREPALRRFIGWIYVQDNQFEKAFIAMRAADEYGDRDGQVVLEFADEAADASAYGAAVQALDYLEERYPRHEDMAYVRFLRAEITYESAQADYVRGAEADFQEAIEAYQAFVDHHPEGSDAVTALQRIAEIQMEHEGNFDEAVAALKQIREQMGDAEAVRQAELQLARAAIMQSNYEEADELLREASAAASDGITQRALLERARLAVLRGAFADALEFADAAAADPSSNVAREAVELRLMLVENKHAPDSTALVRYGEAMVSHQQGRYDEAIAQLDDVIASFPTYPFADDARLLRARTFREKGDREAAQQAFMQLSNERPRSPVADQALYEAARLLEDEEPAEARTLYLQLLRSYPASLHAPDARERARDLQND